MWIKFINFGNIINFSFIDVGVRIFLDGKYLFFGRDEGDDKKGVGNIYWVSIEVIYKLKFVNFGML